MWRTASYLGLLTAAGLGGLVALPHTANAVGRPEVRQTSEVVLEARASRPYRQRRSRSRRERSKASVEPPSAAAEARPSEIALPKRNPRRPGVATAKTATKDDSAKSQSQKNASPPEATPPPPPVTTWAFDEILAGRERCLVDLARITVDIDLAPPMRTGQCGTASPVMLRALGSGPNRVTVHPPAMINCAMVQAVHDWLEKTVQPAARQILGEDIVRLESVAGYQCRNRARTTRLSEHAIANAIDILGFVTRSGQTISVLDDWGPTTRDAPQPVAAKLPSHDRTAENEPPLPRPNPIRTAKLVSSGSRAARQPDRTPAARPPVIPGEQFLKRVHERSCDNFKTVLGPDANEDHRNHFHLDLAERKRGAHYCR
ncbi:MAG: extensin family protein [Hyphomicrobiaceae bacterium]